MEDDLRKDLFNEIKLKTKISDPREIASNYLGLGIWKLHDEFYRFMEDSSIKRLLIIAPRNHGKSEIFGHVLPIWAYLNNHNTRCLVVSKAADQAKKTLALIKQDFEKNKKIIQDLGDLKDVPWKEDKIYLKRGSGISLKDPSFEAVGVLGAITGAHFDLIIADDVIDDENVKTQKRRDSVYTWFKKTVEPLLEPNDKIYVVGTRKHYKDLYQNILDNPIWYHTACRYSEEEDHKKCGYRAIIKEPGKWTPVIDQNGTLTEIKVESDYEILLPEKWTIEKLLMAKISMGVQIFNSEYQNDPTGLEGLLLDEDWIQYYPEHPAELEMRVPLKMKIMAFDLAISEKSIEGGDYFAGIVLGLSTNNNFYVIDIIREHLDFPSQVRKILFLFQTHQPDVVVIETNAYQKALAQHLKDVSTLPIVERKQTTDKYQRILEISPYFESKKVFIHKTMDDLVTEYREFPRGEHEDLLDALQLAVSEAVHRTIDYEAYGWRSPKRRQKDEDTYFDTTRRHK